MNRVTPPEAVMQAYELADAVDEAVDTLNEAIRAACVAGVTVAIDVQRLAAHETHMGTPTRFESVVVATSVRLT